MIAGKTPGVTWELRKLVEERVASKLWVLFPPEGNADLDARWQLLRSELVASGIDTLPQKFEDKTALLQFDAQWSCLVVKMQRLRENYLILLRQESEIYFKSMEIYSLRTWLLSTELVRERLIPLWAILGKWLRIIVLTPILLFWMVISIAGEVECFRAGRWTGMVIIFLIATLPGLALMYLTIMYAKEK